MFIEMCKHLNVSDISSLYRTDRYLHDNINDNKNYIYSICQHVQPHGIIQEWWDMEETILKSQTLYMDGKKNGEYKNWYMTGNLSDKGFYVNDKLHGEIKSWYASGELFNRCYYLNGMLHGEYTSWYQNRLIRYKEVYLNGKRHGDCKDWYSTGKLSSHEIYMDGKKTFVIK